MSLVSKGSAELRLTADCHRGLLQVGGVKVTLLNSDFIYNVERKFKMSRVEGRIHYVDNTQPGWYHGNSGGRCLLK